MENFSDSFTLVAKCTIMQVCRELRQRVGSRDPVVIQLKKQPKNTPSVGKLCQHLFHITKFCLCVFFVYFLNTNVEFVFVAFIKDLLNKLIQSISTLCRWIRQQSLWNYAASIFIPTTRLLPYWATPALDALLLWFLKPKPETSLFVTENTKTRSGGDWGATAWMSLSPLWAQPADNNATENLNSVK